ncbi:hypothetical protein [Thaumasiovibrio subtropicus]|uniref:hypothetical protein n=1 Tax=Thaumasiovibrio subtropicus TaxID=1891207 RepID=UPI00131EAFE8|nr:hypothetical protein [Thaumasiovibrio subtropicus]
MLKAVVIILLLMLSYYGTKRLSGTQQKKVFVSVLGLMLLGVGVLVVSELIR